MDGPRNPPMFTTDIDTPANSGLLTSLPHAHARMNDVKLAPNIAKNGNMRLWGILSMNFTRIAQQVAFTVTATSMGSFLFCILSEIFPITMLVMARKSIITEI